MKVVRKILYVIAGIIILLTIFIGVCAYNPGITKKLQGLLFKGKTVEVSRVDTGAAAGEPGEAAQVSGDSVAQEEYRMRSLEELGISEDSMITNIDDYYSNCHDQIVEHGVGDYSFENVIADESLVQEIYSKYSNKEYVDAYMNQTLNEIGGGSYEMNLLVEELVGKHYRLTHQIVINGA